MADSNPDNEDHPAPQSPSDAVQPQLTMQSISYPSMPMTVYQLPPNMMNSQHQNRSKRRQVKNACTNCQKACKKCDDARPCLRCVKYGIAEDCVDSRRKERQKGVKRGPYKKRDGKTNSVEQQLDGSVQPGPGYPVPAAVTAPGPPPMGYMPPSAYSHQGHGVAPPLVAMPHPGKPGESPYAYATGQIVYFAAMPHPMSGQEGEVYYPAMYPVAALPYNPAYGPQYMMAPRPDGQMQQMMIAPPPHPAAHYPAYPGPMHPQPVYAKPPSRDMSNELGGPIRDMRLGDPMAGAHGK